MTVSLTSDLEALSVDLLRIAVAQRQAVKDDDWARLEELSDERDALQRVLDTSASHGLVVSRSASERLSQVVHIDSVMARDVQQMVSETSTAMSRAQQGHVALRGYHVTSEAISPLLLDAQS